MKENRERMERSGGGERRERGEKGYIGDRREIESGDRWGGERRERREMRERE